MEVCRGHLPFPNITFCPFSLTSLSFLLLLPLPSFLLLHVSEWSKKLGMEVFRKMEEPGLLISRGHHTSHEAQAFRIKVMWGNTQLLTVATSFLLESETILMNSPVTFTNDILFAHSRLAFMRWKCCYESSFRDVGILRGYSCSECRVLQFGCPKCFSFY